MRDLTAVHDTPDALHHQVIHERLPDWVRQLKPAQVGKLRYYQDLTRQPWFADADEALRLDFHTTVARLNTATFALARTLGNVQPLPTFAARLLGERLEQAFGFKGDVRPLKLVRFSRDWNWSSLQTDLNHQIEPLVQAALQNFAPDLEWQPESVLVDGDFSVSSHLGYPRYHYTPLPFSVQAFAEECHALDLGQRYQAHLDACLRRPETRRQAIEARRQQLALDLLIARLRDGLRDDHAVIQSLCSENPAFTAEAWPRCHRFSLLGVDVLDAVLIFPARNSVAVFLYLPGADEGALTRYPTLGACQRELVRRLNQPAFRQRFLRFIQQDKQQHFASVLQRNFTGDTLASQRESQWTAAADTDLHWQDAAIGRELFGYLCDRHHRRLLNEARCVAVPSADVDEAARQARVQYWESLGLDGLAVAAFFIPGAGELMAAVFVSQILDEVYEGVRAWQTGDIDCALGHVKAVAVDGVSAVVTGLALHATSQLSGRLMEVLRADGTPRLWNGDLEPYRATAPVLNTAPRDAAGLREVEGRRFLTVDGADYEVIRHPDAQRWQIVHPQDPHAFLPAIEHNADGAWRVTHESPLQWSRQRLLRRLGHRFDGYSDTELEIASRLGGVSRDALLDVYLRRRRAPARLLETLQRLRTGEPPADRLDAAIEGIYLPHRTSAISDRLTLWSLPAERAWPASTCLELRLGASNGPLLERAGDRLAANRQVVLKVPGGYRAVHDDAPQALCDDLLDAVAMVLPELTTERMALKARIVDRARQDRQRTMSWLWSGIGYGWSDSARLLGGGDRPVLYPRMTRSAHAHVSRYRALYPTATDAQARSQIDRWTESGRLPHMELRRLEQTLETLRTRLGPWAVQSAERLQVQDALLDSWRRVSVHVTILDLSGLALADGDFVGFPELTGGFEHVDELSLNSNDLTMIPDRLVAPLTALRCFWGSSLRLREVPANLGPRLTVLELTDNLIAWGPDSQAAVERYPNLQLLNLSGNPLAIPPSVGMLPDLDDLSLFDSDLQSLPEGLDRLENLVHLDLTANVITDLPQPLYLSEAAQRALSLEHNPLDAQTIARIHEHYRQTGIDLLVSDESYSCLLHGADAQTTALWLTVSRELPLAYRRALRQLGDTPIYLAARATTRRRFWYMLRWLQSPLARQAATEVDAHLLFRYELAADLSAEVAFPGVEMSERQRTEHILDVAVAWLRYQTVSEAVQLRVPDMNELEFEILKAYALQRLTRDPRLVLRLAPTQAEPVEVEDAAGLLDRLDEPWISQLHAQLLELNGNTATGRAALLAERDDGEHVHAYWVNHLRRRYADDFEHLQDQAHEQLQAAEASMNEGDYIAEAERLRRQNQQDREQLLDQLTRSIADGSQTRW